MAQDDLSTMLVDASRDGRADEIACGLMALGVTAALLFLREGHDGSREIPEDEQRRNVEDGLLVRDKAIQFGRVAASKLLPPDTEPDTAESFAGTVASAVVASVALTLVTRACGGRPVASSGMVAMAAQALLKDLGQIEEPRR
jgi:hypothetical protein